MKCPFPLAFGLALSLLASTHASAAYTGVTYNPNPIIIGNVATYSLTGTKPSDVKGWHWQYRTHSATCLGTWTDITATPFQESETVIEARPGTYDIQCIVSFTGYPGNMNPPDIPYATTVTIAPPNGFRLQPPSPLGQLTSANYGPAATSTSLNGADGIWFNFILTVGGVDVGKYIAGSPVEKITDITLNGVSQADSNWTTPSSDVRFYLYENMIKDFKSVNGNGSFATQPIGSTTFIRTQHLKMVFTDVCGNVIYDQEIGSIKLKTVKISGTTYQILEQ